MASLAPLESARIGSNAVFDAGSSDPSAVTTTLSDVPVSFMPYLVLINVLDAPESNMACRIASSIAFASARLLVCCAFLRSNRRAHRRDTLDIGLGPFSMAVAANSLCGVSSGGGGASPVAAR
eukprot:scaffold103213_cov41-Cyclotella_meneghiniana.AAC.1